jgi:hypothetical protein
LSEVLFGWLNWFFSSPTTTKQDKAVIQQQELKAQEIRELMQAVCREHLSLEANVYICTSAMLYDVLMKVASEWPADPPGHQFDSVAFIHFDRGHRIWCP